MRSQDYFILLTYMAWNPVGQYIVWDYVRENWPKLVDRFTLNDRYMGKMISDITKKFSSSTRLEEMKAFFAKYPNAGNVSTMYQKYLYLIHFLTSLWADKQVNFVAREIYGLELQIKSSTYFFKLVALLILEFYGKNDF